MSTTQEKTGVATGAGSIPEGSWRSDPVHSHAGFAVKHTAAKFMGDFRDFEVVLSNDGGEPRLEGSVRVDSVDVRDENLMAHLLSPEFFDAERHPEVRFASTGVRLDGNQLVVDGELEIHGEKKAVSARGELSGPAVGPGGTDRIGIDLETVVDRTDYGLNWQMELPDGGDVLGYEVTISVHLELVKEV